MELTFFSEKNAEIRILTFWTPWKNTFYSTSQACNFAIFI